MSQENFSSINEIMSAGYTAQQAEKIIGLIHGTIEPESFKSVEKWVSDCYNQPHDIELILKACNEALETHGIESITPTEGEHISMYWGNCVASYCNTGDTYCPTVLYDTKAGFFRFISWGDFIEKNGY